MFIGRKEEMKKLDQMYKSGGFEFAVVYGRRRIGKTTLITEFCKGKKAIYYMASESTSKDNLESFSRAVFEVLSPGLEMPPFQSFDQLFRFIGQHLQERLILVIDEYPYLAASEKAVSSLIQAYIDQYWKDSPLMLILCGSSMSFMENQVLGYKSPLYGRRTGQFRLRPFTYFEAEQFFPGYIAEEKALIYGVTGGIPEYLSRVRPELTVDENIVELFFTSSGRLFEEPSNLLKQEMKNYAAYHAVISAVAKGKSRLNEIATTVGEETSACANHLKALISLGLIKKEVPYMENEKSRKTIYRLDDNMFRFWYRFVAPDISGIERGLGKWIYENKVKGQLADFMGSVFEEICIQHLYRPDVIENAPFFYGSVGRWWGTDPRIKSQVEIDILGTCGEHMLLGECKWRNEKTDVDVLEKLRYCGEMFHQREKWYYLFSKSGFTGAIREKAKESDRIRLIGFADMEKYKDGRN